MAGHPDVGALLVHEPFVRALARAVLKGDDRVDDVVQETWLVALRTPPRSPGALRSFLGAVARNIALRVRREDRRLERRHVEAPGARPAAAAAEIAAREEIRRKLVAALLSIEEPYREALLLRYYESLPPRAIARRIGVPVETVRTRVRRGLERLRLRMDADHRGDRRAWALVLAPLAVGGSAAASATRIAAAVLLLAAGVLAVALSSRGTPAAPRAVPDVAAAAARPAPSEDPDGTPSPPPAAAGKPGEVRGVLAEPLPPGAAVRVRVTAGGETLADRRVAPGPFSVPFAGGEFPIVVEIAGEGLRRRAFLVAERSVDLGSVRLAQAARYGGIVRDAEGSAATGVTVEAYQPSERRLIAAPATTDAAGRFVMDLDEIAAAPWTGPDGSLLNYRLVLRRGTEHAGPYPLHRSGWTGGHEIRADWNRGVPVQLVDDATGRPLAGVRCEVAPLGDHPRRAASVLTTNEGVLHVPAPGWAEADLAIDHPAHGRLHCVLSRNIVAVAPELRVGPRTIRDISLTVLGPDRLPAAGARVEIRGGWTDPDYLAGLPLEHASFIFRNGLPVRHEGTVDAQGTLRWRNLVPEASRGEFRILHWTARYELEGRNVVERAPEIVEPDGAGAILLGDPGRERELKVVVTEGDTGRIPELRSLVARFGARHARAGAVRVEGGTPVWPVLVPLEEWDEVVFLVDARGRRPREARVPRAQVEEALARDRALPLLLAYDEGYGRLRVLAPDGTPATGATVAVAIRGATTTGARATADGAGEVLLDDLAGGAAHVVYALDPATERAAFVDPWWPSAEPAVVVLLEPEALRFRMVFEDGGPAAGIQVSIEPVQGFLGVHRRVTADAEGRVECPPFVHSAHVLKVVHRGAEGQLYRLTLSPRDTALGESVILRPQ